MGRIFENIIETIVAFVPSSAGRHLSAWLFADVDVTDRLTSLISAAA